MSDRNNQRRQAYAAKAKKDKATKPHVQPKSGGLDLIDQSSATPKDMGKIEIRDVATGDYQAKQEENWTEVLSRAFKTRCEEYLEPDARDYYFATAQGRQPFHCYLQIEVVVKLSRAFKSKLTLNEMRLMVAEDGREGESTYKEVCRHQLIIIMTQKAADENRSRAAKLMQPIRKEEVQLTEDEVNSCRFTPVRWLVITSDKLVEQRFYERAGEFGNVLDLLARTKCWNFLGSYFVTPDPRDNKNKKERRLPVAGAPVLFMANKGRYQTFPHSPLVIMFKMSPKQIKARASVGPEFIEKMFKQYLETATLPDDRELDAQVAEEVWDGNYSELFDALDSVNPV